MDLLYLHYRFIGLETITNKASRTRKGAVALGVIEWLLLLDPSLRHVFTKRLLPLISGSAINLFVWLFLAEAV